MKNLKTLFAVITICFLTTPCFAQDICNSVCNDTSQDADVVEVLCNDCIEDFFLFPHTRKTPAICTSNYSSDKKTCKTKYTQDNAEEKARYNAFKSLAKQYNADDKAACKADYKFSKNVAAYKSCNSTAAGLYKDDKAVGSSDNKYNKKIIKDEYTWCKDEAKQVFNQCKVINQDLSTSSRPNGPSKN